MDDEIICYCSQVTKKEILQAIKDGSKTLGDIRQATSACTVGRCNELSPKKICCSSAIAGLLKEHVTTNGGMA